MSNFLSITSLADAAVLMVSAAWPQELFLLQIFIQYYFTIILVYYIHLGRDLKLREIFVKLRERQPVASGRWPWKADEPESWLSTVSPWASRCLAET